MKVILKSGIVIETDGPEENHKVLRALLWRSSPRRIGPGKDDGKGRTCQFCGDPLSGHHTVCCDKPKCRKKLMKKNGRKSYLRMKKWRKARNLPELRT